MRKLSAEQKQNVSSLLAKMVAIKSVNSGPETARAERAEEQMAAFVSQQLQNMGMQVEAREFEPGRPNLIAHWPDQGEAGAKTIMMGAHMDTVPVDGMTVDPFTVAFRDGRAYGRGTCDTKGSMAAFLTALAIARREKALPTEKIYFVATCAEETCCQGAKALMQTGFRTDVAIVGEPTGCQVVTAHKGPLWLQVETHGRSCHASLPQNGVNAVDLMSRLIQFVHGPWQKHIQQRSHPLLGTSTMVVTRVDGGDKINIIPSGCRSEIDGRFVPGISMDQVVADFKRMAAKHLGGEHHFTVVSQQSFPALDCSPDAAIARKLLGICREANGQAAPLGVNYFADTGPFDQFGIQAVLFGPGDIAQAHTADEYIELEQLYQGTAMMLTLLTSHAGRRLLES